MSTIEIDNSSTDSSSNKTHVKCQKYKSRSYESLVMRYADKMKETYEKSQEKVMTQTKEYVSKLMKSEKEMIDKMLDNNRIILKETTNQLLYGLQHIFGVATSTRTLIHLKWFLPLCHLLMTQCHIYIQKTTYNISSLLLLYLKS